VVGDGPPVLEGMGHATTYLRHMCFMAGHPRGEGLHPFSDVTCPYRLEPDGSGASWQEFDSHRGTEGPPAWWSRPRLLRGGEVETAGEAAPERPD